MKAFFLILASAALVAPVGAAEVGVRHTWGHTTSNVHNGRSVTRSQSQGQFDETSIGGGGVHGAGSGFIRREHGSYSNRTRESYDFNSRTTSGFSESTTFSR